MFYLNDVKNELIGCTESTDIDALLDIDCPVEQNVHVLTEFIKFCIEAIVPSQVVKCYNNNKPWVKQDLKTLLQ